MNPLIIIFCFSLILLSGCKSTPPNTHATEISPGMAHNLILQQEGNRSFQIIDVRTPSEFNNHHISGAVNIDWPSQKNELSNLNPNHTILLYCRSGRRSQAAMNFLKTNGFKHLFNISGGLIQWERDIKSLTPSPLNEY